MPKRKTLTASRELKRSDIQRKLRSKAVCLMCGQPALPLICSLCARRLRREALLEEIEDEKPTHLSRT
jgi:ribosomal protein L32